MIETLLGGLLGGAFRLAPEILKWLDRNGERSHELSMQDKALEFEKLRGAQRMGEIGASADAAWNTGAIEALRDAVRTQGEKTGVAWADALPSSFRPVIVEWHPKLSHFEDNLHPNLSHPNRLSCLFFEQGWARSDQRGNFEQITQTCPSRQGLHPTS
jgi:hypothetical protein